MELADIFKVHEIYSKQYQKMNRDWLLAKYYHSLAVVKVGKHIIESDKNLSLADKGEYEAMINALLLHDFARSHEKKEDGSTAFRYHGAEGMMIANKDYGITDLRVLFPILMHDQMDTGFMTQTDAELMENPQYKVLRTEIRENILTMRQNYQGLSKCEKQSVNRVCALVKDADTLANMQDFEIMFPLTKEAKEAKISPAVWQAVSTQNYVNYNDVKTLPDRAMAYFAWAFKFQYATTLEEANKGKLFEKMKAYVIQSVWEEQKDNNPDIKIQLEQVSRQFDLVISMLEKHKEKLFQEESIGAIKIDYKNDEDIAYLLNNNNLLSNEMNKPNAVTHLEDIIFSPVFPRAYRRKSKEDQKEMLKTLSQAKGVLSESKLEKIFDTVQINSSTLFGQIDDSAQMCGKFKAMLKSCQKQQIQKTRYMGNSR